MYELREMIEIFTEHAKEAEKERVRAIEEFKENNPDAKIPKWFMDKFSLPLALKSICSEILKLQK
jgi:hypothetical protein